MARTREATCKILEMIDEGVIDAKAVAEMCLAYMSEYDVADMARVNELFIDESDESDEDDDSDPTDDFNYVGSRHHY